MKKKIISSFCALCFVTSASSSEVASFFANLKTFKANFTQSVYQNDALVQSSTGSVSLKKPMKFKWVYKSPEQMQLVSDGQRFYHYDVDLAQVTTKPVSQVTNNIMSTLLNGDSQIDNTFHVMSMTHDDLDVVYPNQASQWKSNAVKFFELTPKDYSGSDSDLLKAVIGINNNNKLAVLYAVDAYGNNTFIFNNVKQNTGIKDSAFAFKAPKGVDVLGQ